jgi:hypothetical protein
MEFRPVRPPLLMLFFSSGVWFRQRAIQTKDLIKFKDFDPKVLCQRPTTPTTSPDDPLWLRGDMWLRGERPGFRFFFGKVENPVENEGFRN